jgi:hypothetical protein
MARGPPFLLVIFGLRVPPPTLPQANIGCPLPPTQRMERFHFCVDPPVISFCDILLPHDAVTDNPKKISSVRNFTSPSDWDRVKMYQGR